LSSATVDEPAKVRDPWSPTLDNCTAAKLHGDIREKRLGPNCMAMPEATITERIPETRKLAVASFASV
jgi:hypothetical protein